MNNRTAILVVSGAAVFLLIAVLIVFYVADSVARADVPPPENGSLLHPQVQREDPPAYVVAELYQNVRLDVASGVYDQHGVLRGAHWTHDGVSQTCSIDLVLAIQQGRDQLSPASTPTPVALDAVETYAYSSDPTPQLESVAITHVVPTPDPNAPTPVPPPLASSVSWIGWEGRPVAIEADGVATLDLPRDATVSAHLSVWTGPHQTGQVQLARLPLPEPEWSDGIARIRLREASGRFLMDSDHVDAHHRSARIRIEAGPLSDCHGLNLRWPKPAAIVLKALTAQPYADWQNHELPPAPAPSPAALSGITLTGVTLDPAFDGSQLAYTAAAPYVLAETTVRPVLADPEESYVVNLGGVQQSDNAPAVVQLAQGQNVIAVVVSSADGNTTRTYTVAVSRDTASADASLSALTLGGTSPDEWQPDFAPGVYDYDVRVPHSTVRTAVLPSTTHRAATFIVATEPAEALTDSGYGTALVELPEGATTTVTITVTAEDASTTQDYVVRVHRAGP